jgi:hypothetical protein
MHPVHRSVPVSAHFCVKTEAIDVAGSKCLCHHVSPHDTENSFSDTLATSGETHEFCRHE